MTFRFPWRGCGLVLCLAAFGADAQVPTPGGTFPPVPPASSQVSTNSQRTTRKDGLKFLEEELSRSLRFFSGKPDLDGLLAPTQLPRPVPQPVFSNNRSKDSADFDGGWENLGKMKDPTSAGKDQESFSVGAERNDSRNRVGRDRYEIYKQQQRSYGNPNAARDDAYGSSYKANRSGRTGAEDDSNVPSSVREKEKSLREKLFGGETRERIYNPGGDKSVFSGFFSTEDRSGFSREQLDAQKEYLNRYREVLGTSPSSPLGAAQDLLKMQATQPMQPALTPGQPSAFATTAGSPFRRDNAAAPPSTHRSLLNPTTMPDRSDAVLNSWNPLRQAPTYETPKPAPLQAPPFAEAPRRRF